MLAITGNCNLDNRNRKRYTASQSSLRISHKTLVGFLVIYYRILRRWSYKTFKLAFGRLFLGIVNGIHRNSKVFFSYVPLQVRNNHAEVNNCWHILNSKLYEQMPFSEKANDCLTEVCLRCRVYWRRSERFAFIENYFLLFGTFSSDLQKYQQTVEW